MNNPMMMCRIKMAVMANCRSVGYRQFGMASMAKNLGFFTNISELEKNWLEYLETNVTEKNCNEVLDILLSPAQVQRFNS